MSTAAESPAGLGPGRWRGDPASGPGWECRSLRHSATMPEVSRLATLQGSGWLKSLVFENSSLRPGQPGSRRGPTETQSLLLSESVASSDASCPARQSLAALWIILMVYSCNGSWPRPRKICVRLRSAVDRGGPKFEEARRDGQSYTVRISRGCRRCSLHRSPGGCFHKPAWSTSGRCG